MTKRVACPGLLAETGIEIPRQSLYATAQASHDPELHTKRIMYTSTTCTSIGE